MLQSIVVVLVVFVGNGAMSLLGLHAWHGVQHTPYLHTHQFLLHQTFAKFRNHLDRVPIALSFSAESGAMSIENTEFLEWEQEEIDAQKNEYMQEIENLRSSTDHDDDDGLPEYMLKMISRFQDSQTDESFSVPESKLPTIAIIGRPNTGKSTIANKLTDSHKSGAIVHDTPGITRDRTYRTGAWCGYNFQVVDTGGIIFDDTNDIFAEKITEQALIALREANAGILVCDGQVGPTPLDFQLANWLRKNSKVPIYIAVNKCESVKQGVLQAADFWQLGFGTPYPCSGIHGSGLGEILDVICAKNINKVTNVLKENCTNIAFIGRPNVGKSSLFNR